MSLPSATRDNDNDSSSSSSSSSSSKPKKYAKPLSAYAIFYEEQRATMLLACLKNGTMTLKEVAKVVDNTIKDCRHRKKEGKLGRRDIKSKVQAMWRSMSTSQRDLYEAASQQQVQQCQAQLKAWRASQEQQQQEEEQQQEEQQQAHLFEIPSSFLDTIPPQKSTPKLTNNHNTSTPTMNNHTPPSTTTTLTSSSSPPTRTIMMPLPETMVPPNLLCLPSTTVNYGECESETLSLPNGGSIHGSHMDEESYSCSSVPMSFTYQTTATTSDDTTTLHHNNNNNNHSSTMDFITFRAPPQQEDIQYVPPHNYVDLSSPSVVLVEEPQPLCPYYHPLTNNTNHTNPDDNDLTRFPASLPPTKNTDVEDLASQLDVEAVAFICSTFNS